MRDELESWPRHLLPGWLDDVFDDSEEVEEPPDATDEEAIQAEITRNMARVTAGSELSPRPTQEELVEAKRRINTISNPLGNIILGCELPIDRQFCNLRLEINNDAMKLEEEIEERLRQ